jgi:hypothetical protein
MEIVTEPMEIAEPTVSEKVSPKITIAPPKPIRQKVGGGAKASGGEAKPKRSAALSVLTNPDLLQKIGSYTNPKNYVDDFFKKNDEGNDIIDNQRFYDFLIEKGMKSSNYRGQNYIVDSDQYIDLLGILARVLFDVGDKSDYGYKKYEDYYIKIKYPALRKVIRVLLNKQVPADFDYNKFWRNVSQPSNYQQYTRIDNVSMKKLFSNWKNKGKRTKGAYQSESDPMQGN